VLPVHLPDLIRIVRFDDDQGAGPIRERPAEDDHSRLEYRVHVARVFVPEGLFTRRLVRVPERAGLQKRGIVGRVRRHFASPSETTLLSIGIRRALSYCQSAVNVHLLTLPPLEAVGFLLHRERPAVAGLTLAPQAFNLSVCPTARSILIPSSLMFFAALWSRSWQAPQASHFQKRSLIDSSSWRCPHSEHNCDDGNQRPMKTKFRAPHLALYSICRNVSRCAASLTDLASLVFDMPFRFSVSYAIALFPFTTELENL